MPLLTCAVIDVEAVSSLAWRRPRLHQHATAIERRDDVVRRFLRTTRHRRCSRRSCGRIGDDIPITQPEVELPVGGCTTVERPWGCRRHRGGGRLLALRNNGQRDQSSTQYGTHARCHSARRACCATRIVLAIIQIRSPESLLLEDRCGPFALFC